MLDKMVKPKATYESTEKFTLRPFSFITIALDTLGNKTIEAIDVIANKTRKIFDDVFMVLFFARKIKICIYGLYKFCKTTH